MYSTTSPASTLAASRARWSDSAAVKTWTRYASQVGGTGKLEGAPSKQVQGYISAPTELQCPQGAAPGRLLAAVVPGPSLPLPHLLLLTADLPSSRWAAPESASR